MPSTNPRGTGNKKHLRQDETSEQLPAPKRPANSRQPSRQRSPSMTIQDDDVIEATPPPVTPAPLPTIELERRLDANETRLDSFVHKVDTKFEEQGRQLEEILNHLTGQRGQNNDHDEDNDDAQRGNIVSKSPLQLGPKKHYPGSASPFCATLST